MKKTTLRISLSRYLVKIPLLLIRFYQEAISPHFPPTCRYLPTCSEYAYEAYQKWGLLRGTWLTLKRLSTCHPLCTGGVDNVPDPDKQ